MERPVELERLAPIDVEADVIHVVDPGHLPRKEAAADREIPLQILDF
jgi:hypothetical protein